MIARFINRLSSINCEKWLKSLFPILTQIFTYRFESYALEMRTHWFYSIKVCKFKEVVRLYWSSFNYNTSFINSLLF